MLAPSPIPPPPSTMEESLDFDNGAFVSGGSGHRQFKRHKVLPRPPSVRSHDTDSSPPHRRSTSSLDIDPAIDPIQFQPPSPPALKRQSKRIPTGPELPPTPPTHSRTTSSSSHSAVPSSPTISDPMLQHTPEPVVPSLSPATPPDQRSPPTPDVTPPHQVNRPRALRLSPSARGTSGTIATESRTVSFTTAREEPSSSSEDESRSTVRRALASGRTSQSTVRKGSSVANGETPERDIGQQALSHLPSAQPQKIASRREETYEPKMNEVSSNGAEHQARVNPDRSATVKLKSVVVPRTRPRGYRREIVEDVDNTILPSSAAQAVRHVSLSDKSNLKAPSLSHRDVRRHSSNPVRLDTSVAPARKASSGSSPRSASSSTVVEAFLIEGPPRRHKTLRHVRKQHALREMTSHSAEPSLLSTDSNTTLQHQDPPIRITERDRHESLASSSTVNSIASRKARRDVWKSGGIPVVVVPDRRSSTRSTSREPSLRSTSSRRSRRTQSLSSAPLDMSDRPPPVDRQSRHTKSRSVSDGSERTIDFPPAIPTRSSSLSAPTSRNASRTQSLTAESIRAHDAIQQKLEHDQLLRRLTPIQLEYDKLSSDQLQRQTHLEDKNANTVTLNLPDSHQTQPKNSVGLIPGTHPVEEDSSRLSVQAAYLASPKSDRFDESSLSTKKYTARNTPFSVASFETNGTTAEVSEALAIHMYPHQNSSVLMVNHSAKPSDASVATSHKHTSIQADGDFQVEITPAKDDTDLPVTPPQPQFSLGDIDSPLRNPRSPPEPPNHPPALAFIPATPSGVTPAPDKDIQIGNFFESIAEKPPPARRPSLVKRAFSRRRRHETVDYPPNASRTSQFLKRALSIPRRRGSREDDRITEPYRGNYPWEDGVPPEEHKLHPFWRPQWPDDAFFYDDEYDGEYREEGRSRGRERDEGYMRYPLVDNRPPRPKRSLSARVKHTFAVLPSRRSDELIEDGFGPERRTIQRTTSGNLRVMKRRSSTGSLRQRLGHTEPSSSAPNFEPSRSFWQGSSAPGRTRSMSRRRFSLEEPIEKVQGLSRRFSERRREKRSQELRQRISGPKDVRDGVEDMIRSSKHRDYV